MELTFKDKIDILESFIPTNKQIKEYEKKNYIGNKIEILMLHNAQHKGSLARDINNWYELIGKEKVWLGSMSTFALNWEE